MSRQWTKTLDSNADIYYIWVVPSGTHLDAGWSSW